MEKRRLLPRKQIFQLYFLAQGYCQFIFSWGKAEGSCHRSHIRTTLFRLIYWFCLLTMNLIIQGNFNLRKPVSWIITIFKTNPLTSSLYLQLFLISNFLPNFGESIRHHFKFKALNCNKIRVSSVPHKYKRMYMNQGIMEEMPIGFSLSLLTRARINK